MPQRGFEVVMGPETQLINHQEKSDKLQACSQSTSSYKLHLLGYQKVVRKYRGRRNNYIIYYIALSKNGQNAADPTIALDLFQERKGTQYLKLPATASYRSASSRACYRSLQYYFILLHAHEIPTPTKTQPRSRSRLIKVNRYHTNIDG